MGRRQPGGNVLWKTFGRWEWAKGDNKCNEGKERIGLMLVKNGKRKKEIKAVAKELIGIDLEIVTKN